MVLHSEFSFDFFVVLLALFDVELQSVEHVRELVESVRLTLLLVLLPLVGQEVVHVGPQQFVDVVVVGVDELFQLGHLRLLIRLLPYLLQHFLLLLVIILLLMLLLLLFQSLQHLLVIQGIRLESVEVIQHLLNLTELLIIDKLVVGFVVHQLNETTL